MGCTAAGNFFAPGLSPVDHLPWAENPALKQAVQPQCNTGTSWTDRPTRIRKGCRGSTAHARQRARQYPPAIAGWLILLTARGQFYNSIWFATFFCHYETGMSLYQRYVSMGDHLLAFIGIKASNSGINTINGYKPPTYQSIYFTQCEKRWCMLESPPSWVCFELWPGN